MAGGFSLKARNYFIKGLTAFAFLSLEFAVIALEYLVFDLPKGSGFKLWSPLWYRLIIHWGLTIMVWTSGSLYFYRWARKNGVLDELFSFKLNKISAVLSIVAVLACLGINYLVGSTIEDNDAFPQILIEFNAFKRIYGNKAFIISIFQNLYYICETLLVAWTVAFMQKAGEALTNRKFIWGALGAALTWGLVHFVSHPVGAVFTVIGAFIYGIIYLVTEKSFYPVFLFIWLSFVF